MKVSQKAQCLSLICCFKDQSQLTNYTNEVNNLVTALKSKDKEIQDIQESMIQWKQDTLQKLADKFEIELSKELDRYVNINIFLLDCMFNVIFNLQNKRRMQEYKADAATQQAQFDMIRKEMDNLSKECRDTTVSDFLYTRLC